MPSVKTTSHDRWRMELNDKLVRIRNFEGPAKLANTMAVVVEILLLMSEQLDDLRDTQ